MLRCAVLGWAGLCLVTSGLPLLQVDAAGLDVRMVALAQQQRQLQAALDRKKGLLEQLTQVSACPGTLAYAVCYILCKHTVLWPQ